MLIFFFILISYLLGSIPFGYIIAKTKKIDIRTVGSGNIGGTNVLRALGFKYALAVALLDMLKSYIPTFFAALIFGNSIVIAAFALAAIIGHMFPVYLKFKGGKGVSTAGGALLAILGIKLWIGLLILWIILLFIFRIMSLTNLLLLAVLIPFFAFAFHSPIYTIWIILVSILITWAHRENIQRLRSGTEKKLTFKQVH